MVTGMSDFDKAIDRWLDVWATYIRMFRSRKWPGKTPPLFPRRAGAMPVFSGVYTRGWLPAPDKETLAALADRLDFEHDAVLVEGFAALVQRASIIDPEVSAKVESLISSVAAVGVLEHGCAGRALQAQTELDRLVSAPVTWSSLDEVLGDAHSRPDDLLNLAWARFGTCTADGPWRQFIVVIERLRVETYRSVAADPDISPQERKQWMVYHSVIDLFSLVTWMEFSGVRMAALHECLRSAKESGDGQC